MLVGPPGVPGKIAEYAGRGDLRAVSRRGCDLRKGKNEILTDDDSAIAQQAIPATTPRLST